MVELVIGYLKTYWVEFKAFSSKWKILIILITLVAIGSFLSSGIFGIDPGRSYVLANYENCKLMVPDLISYIKSDLSNKLTDLDKETRIVALTDWLKLNEERYSNLGKEKE